MRPGFRTGSGKSSTVLALFRGIDQHLVIWDALKFVEMYDAVSALVGTSHHLCYCGLQDAVIWDHKLEHLVVGEEIFSKGQRQLLCLARALLTSPRYINLGVRTLPA